MSWLSEWAGVDARREAQRRADRAYKEARAERKKFKEAEDAANLKKTEEERRMNQKSIRSARATMRRGGFLDSGVEGASGVLG